MPQIVKRKKALSVSPLKVSQTVGGALAFLGIEGSVPLMHGSQGCTAFGKVFLVRHFREPIPLQTTAMDQTSSVLGADSNVVEAIGTIVDKSSARMVGVVSTGLAETQGCHLKRSVDEFREARPDCADVRVVEVNTPDFKGCMETGYAAAVERMIDVLTPAGRRVTRDTINVLAAGFLTPGDIEEIEECIESFGLVPRVIPNLAGSLGGHLSGPAFCPTTNGGTPIEAFDELGDARRTLVIGKSLERAGTILEQRTGVPTCVLPHLHTLPKFDRFVHELLHASDRTAPPPRLLRARDQLRDALLDTHFSLGMRRVGIAADPDLLLAFAELIESTGGTVVAAVSPSKGPALADVPTEEVALGDLEDLERRAKEGDAEILIGSSHVAETAARLKVPLVRAGFPLYDTIGAYRKRWIGYRGIRDALFDLANECHALGTGEIALYHSMLTQKHDEHQVPPPLEMLPCSNAS